jgi:hypothetical protein
MQLHQQHQHQMPKFKILKTKHQIPLKILENKPKILENKSQMKMHSDHPFLLVF